MAKQYKYRVENKYIIPFDVGYPYIKNESNSDSFYVTLPRMYGDIDLALGEFTIWCTPQNKITINNLPVVIEEVTDTTVSFSWLLTETVTQFAGLTKWWIVNDYGTGKWITNNSVFVVRVSYVPNENETEIESDLIPGLNVVGRHWSEIVVDGEYDEEANQYVFHRMEGSIFTLPVIAGGDIDLSEIQEELDRHDLDISTLKIQSTSQAAAIDQLQDDYGDIDERLLIAENEINEIETDITDINDVIIRHTGEIETLQDTVVTAITTDTTDTVALDRTGGTVTINVTASGGGSGLPEAPTDGNIYARSNSAWKQLNTIKGRTLIIDGSSTETIEDGSEFYPIKDTPDNVSDIATFGNILRIDPGTYQGDMTVDVDNITIFTEGATGQYRAQMNGNMILNAIRTGIANFQILGDITTNTDAELVYMTNVDMKSYTFDGSGYSRLDDCFIETTLVVNSGAVDLRNCQFEDSIITDVVVNGGSLTAVNTTGMNIIHNGGTVTLLGCTMDGVTSTADDGALYLIGGQFVSGSIDKTGNCPYVISGLLHTPGADTLNGIRLELGESSTDILANRDTTHYTAADNFISGHLAGIDSALGQKLETPVGESTYLRTQTGWVDYKTIENPSGLFVARNGGPAVTWTSPTAFNFNGGVYIKAATRGTLGVVNLPTQSDISYQSGVFITFDPIVNTIGLWDAVNILSFPTNLYLVGIMGPGKSGAPAVKIFGGEVIEYHSDGGVVDDTEVDVTYVPVNYTVGG